MPARRPGQERGGRPPRRSPIDYPLSGQRPRLQNSAFTLLSHTMRVGDRWNGEWPELQACRRGRTRSAGPKAKLFASHMITASISGGRLRVGWTGRSGATHRSGRLVPPGYLRKTCRTIDGLIRTCYQPVRSFCLDFGLRRRLGPRRDLPAHTTVRRRRTKSYHFPQNPQGRSLLELSHGRGGRFVLGSGCFRRESRGGAGCAEGSHCAK